MTFEGVMKTQEGFVAVMKEEPIVSASSMFFPPPYTAKGLRGFTTVWAFNPLPIEEQEAFEAILEVNEIAPGVKFDE